MAALADEARVREPLPLTVAVSAKGYGSVAVSPEGEWLANTWETDEDVLAGRLFTPSGVSTAQGDRRDQITLTNIRNGQVIPLGDGGSFNWAPVWAPDGHRVAYYSDEGGEAGIWIWDKASARAERFPGVIVRSFFAFETARWSPDGRHVLCKVLPNGMSIADANAMALPSREAGNPDRFSRTAPTEPAVVVFRSLKTENDSPGNPDSKSGDIDWTSRELGDLAILDIADHSITRIAKSVKAVWWAFSPDGKYVAYTSLLGSEANSEQLIYQISIYELASGKTRVLASRVRLAYGMELSWAPDGHQIAYIASGPESDGAIVAISLSNGAPRILGKGKTPRFSEGYGGRRPYWDSSGRNVYAVGTDGKLWRIDATSCVGAPIGDITGHRIDHIVARRDTPSLWTTNRGRVAWVIAHDRQGTRGAIFSIDLGSGQATPILEDERLYAGNFDASDATEQIIYVACDQQHLNDAWALDITRLTTHQITHLNKALERYELGNAKQISWPGGDGQKLSGTLLLPPAYRAGQHVPLVVWVYGGYQGSRDVPKFGLAGTIPVFNFHVLATRGYAVLSPDAPVRKGMEMRDLVSAVIPGVNAAVDQGYADPARLAVMGQSYGAYSTLALISQTNRFKAAIITAAVTHPDLVADYLNNRPENPDSQIGYYEEGQGNMPGTPWTQRDSYLVNSPIYLFDQIETPLLIGQGEKDGNLIASDATFAALKRLGKEVEYRIYRDEGHVLQNRANVLDFWQRRLDFLDEHLNVLRDDHGNMKMESGLAARTH